MVLLNEQYPIMHNHVILDADNSECPIMQYRCCLGQLITCCLLFKRAGRAKRVRAGEMNKNWLLEDKEDVTGLDLDVLTRLLQPPPKNMC